MLRGGEAEVHAWLKAVDDIARDLSEEQLARIKVLRDEWKQTNDKWRDENSQKMRDLQRKLSEGRRDGGRPDPALMDQMRLLIESRPKFDETRTKISQVFTPEQVVAHREAFQKQMAALTPIEGGPRGRGGQGSPAGPGGDGVRGRGGAGGERPGRGMPGGTGAGAPPRGGDTPSETPSAK